MAVFNITSFNYLASGKTEKLFNLDLELDGVKYPGMVFIADIDENNDVMNGIVNANRFSLKLSDGTIIHALYDIKDTCIKSTIKKVRSSDSSYDGNSDDYLDIYAPVLESDILGFCQLGDYAYCMTDKTKVGPTMQSTNLLDQRKLTPTDDINGTKYNFKLSEKTLNTYLYDQPSIEHSTISDYFIPKTNLKNLKYNYIIEVPQTNIVNNDYSAGDILGDIFICKNEFDYSYSMDMPDSDTLSVSRKYLGLGTCGDRIYLKFIDNVDYSTSEVDDNSAEIINKQMYDSSKTRNYPFQKVESLDSINRFKSATAHKSNMYSLKIKNTGIESLNDDSNPKLKALYNKIKMDMDNSIRDIAKKVCPVNTELFNIQVT
jgi:hypothetical protein